MKRLLAKIRNRLNRKRDEEVLKDIKVESKEIGYFKLTNVYPLIGKNNIDIYENIDNYIFSRGILFQFEFIVDIEDLDNMTDFIRNIIILDTHINYYKDGKDGFEMIFLIDGLKMQYILNSSDLYNYIMIKYPEFVKAVRDAINFIPLSIRINSASDLYYEFNNEEVNHFEVNNINYYIIRDKKYPINVEYLSIFHSLPEEPFYYVISQELLDGISEDDEDEIETPKDKYNDQPIMSIEELIEKFPDEIE